MSNMIKIRDIIAKPGEKKFSYIDIWKKSSNPPSIVKLPVYIINGLREGPKLCLTAGTHGCEYAGIGAVIRIYKQTKPEELKGAIIGIPIINMPGFENRTPHVNPIDNVDIMRAYPGKPNGTVSLKIIHVLMEEIITKTNYWIDCHGGDTDEYQMEAGYVYFPKVGDSKTDINSEVMARLYGFKNIVTVREWRGLEVAAKNGVPCIMAENGESGMLTDRLETDITHHIKGITNVMRYYGMIEGKPKITIKQKYAKSLFRVRSNYGGLFYPKVKPGDIITKDQVVGDITNLQGECIGNVTAPCNGVVRIMKTWHLIKEGDVVMVGLVSPKPISPLPEIDQVRAR